MNSVYRFVPCPQYDVSGMECWLSEMAAQGYILTQDGIFCGVATFEKSTPRNLRYCLQAASKSTSMWADNYGDPDDEEVEISKEFGWEYVAKRGEFHIYCTDSLEARELHTDKEVQALAMNAMKKRQKDSIFNSLFYGIVYPWLIIRGNIILSMIHAGTWIISILLLAGLWMTFHSIFESVRLIKLRKKVLNGESLGSGNNWRRRTRWYFTNNIFRKCLYVVAICLLLNLFGANISNKYYIPLTEYSGEVPFKTMKDFIPNGEMKLMNMNVGNLNTVREWSDFLSPVNYEWDEAGTVTSADGTILSGGLEVIYHETKADWIAKRLVTEYLRKAKGEREYEPLEIQMEELDEAVAYTTLVHFPNIILRNENKVICARFYTSGEKSVTYELEEWAGFLAESLYKQVKLAVGDYAGPVLPLTTLSDASGVSVVRNISLDFAPYREFDGNYKKVMRVGDEYILTNETEEDISITTIYGFVGSLIDDIEAVPDIYFDGKMKEKEIYIGEGLSDYDNWQAYESLLSENGYMQEGLDLTKIDKNEEKLERDKKYEAYKIISLISDEMISKAMKKQGVSRSDLYRMKRVMYVTYDVVIPANDSITLNIYMDKYGSYETYDIMTILGSEFEFIKQTASVKNIETVMLKEQDFGFELENSITEVELDMNKPCYSITVERIDENIWRTIKKLEYNVIPKPKADTIEAKISEHKIFINVYGIDKDYYQKYIKKCINRYKFNIDIEQTEYSFEAYNTDGYHLIADFGDGRGTTMFILLDKPIQFGEYEIPQFAIEQGLPIPKSDLGSYSWNHSESFSLKIGNTLGEEYLSYIEECKKAGFVNSVYDNYPIYSADNENGFALHLRWEGNNTFNIMFSLAGD